MGGGRSRPTETAPKPSLSVAHCFGSAACRRSRDFRDTAGPICQMLGRRKLIYVDPDLRNDVAAAIFMIRCDRSS